MALGKRRRERQLEAFVAASELPQSPDHPFHTALKRLPKEVFDDVFQFILGVAARKNLLLGEALGIDSTTGKARATRIPASRG
jgi:hypothetical protein